MIRKLLLCIATFGLNSASAYEINNHADMTQTALVKSVLNATNASGEFITLKRLGLRPLDPLSAQPTANGAGLQTFPLGTGLGPIPYCFGSARPDPWLVTMTEPGVVSALLAQPPKDSTTAQPDWMSNAGNVKLTIAQFIRYGACCGSELPPAKSVTHFHSPQRHGQRADVLSIPLGPNSFERMLKLYATSIKLKDLWTTRRSPSVDREFV